MTVQIYTYTPNKYSNNSAVLHMTEVPDIMSSVMERLLVEQGHKIVASVHEIDEQEEDNDE